MSSSAMIAVIAILTKIVLLFLLGLSVWSVTIIVDRKRFFKKASDSESQESLRKNIQAKNTSALGKVSGEGVRSRAVQVLMQADQSQDSVLFAMQGFLTEKKLEFSKGLPVLATLGSNAPFVGLFGTVLGIIQAFGSLANEPSAVGGVMAAISEALIATAIGLFVAIPAVVAFNYFSNRMREEISEIEALRDFYISKFLGQK